MQSTSIKPVWGDQLDLGNPLTDGLELWLPMVEDEKAVDFAGDNDGVISGAVWDGEGLDFAAASANHVTVTDFYGGGPSNGITYIFDAYRRTSGELGAGYYLDMNESSGSLLSRGDEGLTLFRDYTGTNGQWRSSSGIVLNGKRAVLALSQVNGQLVNVYIDGVFIKQLGQVTAPSGTPVNSGVLRLGSNTATSRDWDGIIYDTKIYNRALSASEIQQLYMNPNLTEQKKIWLPSLLLSAPATFKPAWAKNCNTLIGAA